MPFYFSLHAPALRSNQRMFVGSCPLVCQSVRLSAGPAVLGVRVPCGGAVMAMEWRPNHSACDLIDCRPGHAPFPRPAPASPRTAPEPGAGCDARCQLGLAVSRRAAWPRRPPPHWSPVTSNGSAAGRQQPAGRCGEARCGWARSGRLSSVTCVSSTLRRPAACSPARPSLRGVGASRPHQLS